MKLCKGQSINKMKKSKHMNKMYKSSKMGLYVYIISQRVGINNFSLANLHDLATKESNVNLRRIFCFEKMAQSCHINLWKEN